MQVKSSNESIKGNFIYNLPSHLRVYLLSKKEVFIALDITLVKNNYIKHFFRLHVYAEWKYTSVTKPGLKNSRKSC